MTREHAALIILTEADALEQFGYQTESGPWRNFYLTGANLQETKLADAINSGTIKVNGDRAKLEEVVSYLDTFVFWFNIVTP